MENFVGDLNLKRYEDYVNVFDALSHPARIKIIGILAEGRQYVSELARLVNISRPLLYMHLKKLETARLVTSTMELSDSGKAMKFYKPAGRREKGLRIGDGVAPLDVTDFNIG